MGRGFKLIVHWVDGSTDEINMRRSNGGGRGWSYRDIMMLQRLVEDGASQIDIAERFLHRKWKAIRREIKRLFGKVDIPGPFLLREEETYGEFAHWVDPSDRENSLIRVLAERRDSDCENDRDSNRVSVSVICC